MWELFCLNIPTPVHVTRQCSFFDVLCVCKSEGADSLMRDGDNDL